jgi:hypothetical protein
MKLRWSVLLRPTMIPGWILPRLYWSSPRAPLSLMQQCLVVLASQYYWLDTVCFKIARSLCRSAFCRLRICTHFESNTRAARNFCAIFVFAACDSAGPVRRVLCYCLQVNILQLTRRKRPCEDVVAQPPALPLLRRWIRRIKYISYSIQSHLSRPFYFICLGFKALYYVVASVTTFGHHGWLCWRLLCQPRRKYQQSNPAHAQTQAR